MFKQPRAGLDVTGLHAHGMAPVEDRRRALNIQPSANWVRSASPPLQYSAWHSLTSAPPSNVLRSLAQPTSPDKQRLSKLKRKYLLVMVARRLIEFAKAY